ncbi:MAG: hypothetical protein JXR83_11430 [Deltaproteobacteria bacterium]|nr:hypothetical protein [Deltaproteobacteria bacterium]
MIALPANRWPLPLAVALAALTPPLAAWSRTLTFTATEPTTVVALAEIVYGRASADIILATANDLAPKAAIAAGQTVHIPVSYTVPVARPTPISVLARKYLPGRDRSALLAAVNNLKPDDQVKPRTALVVPALIWHVARPGDGMRGISRLYYRNAEGRWLLRRINGNRTSDKVEPGERILVPIFASWSDSEKVANRLQAALPAVAASRDDSGDDDADPGEHAPEAAAGDDAVASQPDGASGGAKPTISSAGVERALQAPVIGDGVELFRRGDYLAAVAYFRRTLLEPGLDPTLRVAADVWLASCYVAVDEPERAEEAMRAALRLSPELELDPAQTSPKILHVLETVRQRLAPSDSEIP